MIININECKIMTFRDLLYWPPLVCGVTAGILIFIMSVTGVLLTYERQMISWAEGDYDRSAPTDKKVLSVDEILIKNLFSKLVR